MTYDTLYLDRSGRGLFLSVSKEFLHKSVEVAKKVWELHREVDKENAARRLELFEHADKIFPADAYGAKLYWVGLQERKAL